jgi:hypothetical protein
MHRRPIGRNPRGSRRPRHIAIICDVISKIRHGRTINRRNPYSVDAKGYNMIQAPNNPRKITDSIPIAILKWARVNLIDDTALPPL